MDELMELSDIDSDEEHGLSDVTTDIESDLDLSEQPIVLFPKPRVQLSPISISPRKTEPSTPVQEDSSPPTWYCSLSFTEDSMPSYIVQSFLSDCLLYPKIILHKDFLFFRNYLTSIGMNATCNNEVYVENHEDRFFCVELEKKLLKEILSREDFLPEEGAWSFITRIEIRKKLGLGIWKWQLPQGIITILELFISFCHLNFESFKVDPKMQYFQTFMTEFSFERGFETEEIYVYEKADELRKSLSGYVSPVYSSSSDDDSGDDISSASSVEYFDSDFNPKRKFSALSATDKRSKVKRKKVKIGNSPVTNRSIKTNGSSKPSKPIIKCTKCGNRYKYRTSLNKHMKKAHGAASNSTTCVRKLTYAESDDETVFSDSEGDSDSSCQIVYTNFESNNDKNSDGKRFSKLRTSEGRANVRHQLKEIINDLNIRKPSSKDKHNSSNVKASAKGHKSKLIKCSQCSLTYRYRTSLRKHMRKAHSSKMEKSETY